MSSDGEDKTQQSRSKSYEQISSGYRSSKVNLNQTHHNFKIAQIGPVLGEKRRPVHPSHPPRPTGLQKYSRELTTKYEGEQI